MSSTRYTNDPDSFAQERYISAPQFAEMRPLSGNLVAEKAQLYATRAHREMLFFLHSVSLQPGGLRTLARRIMVDFPHAIGVPALASKTPDSSEIEAELCAHCRSLESEVAGLRLARFHAEAAGEIPPTDLVSVWREIFHTITERHLPRFLADVCLDPEIDLEKLAKGGRTARASYISDVWKILCHYKAEAERGEAEKGVITSIGAALNGALNHALSTRRMVVVEGLAGSGKTHASEEWTRSHPAQARFISLSGITHRTGFFQKIASAIGLAPGGRKAAELQARIEDFFAKSKLMLVVDEAHYLWPQTRRCSGPPELVNWINTALVNQGVPVALICTDQFVRLKGHIEKQTGWTSEQLMHRIKRFIKLPERPTEVDLRAVASSLLGMEWSESVQAWKPAGHRARVESIKLVVGYALISRLPMAAVRDLVDEARGLALAAGRAVVEFEDLKSAWQEYQVPSDVAMKAAFPEPPKRASTPRSQPSKAFVSEGAESSRTAAPTVGVPPGRTAPQHQHA